jgi:hypothetical protein
VNRLFGVLIAAGALLILAMAGGAQALPPLGDVTDSIVTSGGSDYARINYGNFITECPQAGRSLDRQPRPLDRRQRDEVERKSQGGDDVRLNQDFSCFPQDEDSISINPTRTRNLVGGNNDYRLGFGSSGFYSTTNNGKDWYDGIIPAPSVGGAVSPGGYLPSSGDPAIVHDRAGVVYYAQLAFLPNNDSNGVFVSRSTNGGFTWSRSRVGGSNTQTNPAGCPTPPCTPTNDPRQPGDGVVVFDQDNDAAPNFSVTFNDKEYIAAGPRPAGVAPLCFDASHAPVPCAEGAPISPDRLYVTWTRFNSTFFDPPGAFFQTSSQINISYSDDQGRSWSPRKIINGSAGFCTGAFAGGEQCDDSQGSTPTVNPVSGQLSVGFINGDTPDENQYLVVTSKDGGNTFAGPYFMTQTFDINYPRACAPNSAGTSACTRPDCAVRNAQQRSTLTNSCFRVNSYANIVADRRGGAFSDDLYGIVHDNRNGNPASSNVDIFFFRSTDGGVTWIGPTRVNNDRSVAPPNRDCGRAHGDIPRGDAAAACGGVGNFGNDQFFPWVDINGRGDIAITFYDRRLDTNSVKHEWPTSRQRPGNYLAWYFGAVCRIEQTGTVPNTGTTVPSNLRQCAANEAIVNRQPIAPVDTGTTTPGANQTGLPFRNFQISDVPSNLDYAFPRGVFIGDYTNVGMSDFPATQNDDSDDNDEGDDGKNRAFAHWSDARNGRSSGGPAGGTLAPSEPGRNPICEQSDTFGDFFNPSRAENQGRIDSPDDAFLVTLCPPAAKDRKSRGGDKDD